LILIVGGVRGTQIRALLSVVQHYLSVVS